MCCNKNESDIYEDTIDVSREISLQKAVAILKKELEKNKNSVIRPDINPVRGIIKILIATVFLGLMWLLSDFFGISLVYVIITTLIIAIINARKTIVWLILLYQKYAPESMRKACVFEPTCSNYMLQAINKYGLLKGVFKGINRLFRCHQPNGGVDNP